MTGSRPAGALTLSLLGGGAEFRAVGGAWECTTCPGGPRVDNPFQHARLIHLPRAVGVEDRSDWGTR